MHIYEDLILEGVQAEVGLQVNWPNNALQFTLVINTSNNSMYTVSQKHLHSQNIHIKSCDVILGTLKS